MGDCGSCNKSNGSLPSGCNNNGWCKTSGCNKLSVYDWLANMEFPDNQEPFDIIEVRFKGSRKEFYKNDRKFPLVVGDKIVVDAKPGYDVGEVSIIGELVRIQMQKKSADAGKEEVKKVQRLASPIDLEKYQKAKELEENTLHRSREIIKLLNLNMKMGDVEYQGDKSKATFYYTSDVRVDFRDLIKKFAEEFKVKIEMRQIGARQEAGRLGGIGSCGRELCCSTWLTDFKSVSTAAARYQNLSLNPMKLAGQCGKLKCCLNYELDVYLDAIKDFPNQEQSKEVETADGKYFLQKTDIFKKIMWYGVEEGANWYALGVAEVSKIIEMNKKGRKPADIASFAINKPTEKKSAIQTALDQQKNRNHKKFAD